jgi:hypothetical protein
VTSTPNVVAALTAGSDDVWLVTHAAAGVSDETAGDTAALTTDAADGAAAAVGETACVWMSAIW